MAHREGVDAVKVTVRSSRTEVTLEQATAWLRRKGFKDMGDVAVDSHAFLHIDFRELVLLPKDGCYDRERRVAYAIEEAAEMTGRHAIDILREMSEVVP